MRRRRWVGRCRQQLLVGLERRVHAGRMRRTRNRGWHWRRRRQLRAGRRVEQLASGRDGCATTRTRGLNGGVGLVVVVKVDVSIVDQYVPSLNAVDLLARVACTRIDRTVKRDTLNVHAQRGVRSGVVEGEVGEIVVAEGVECAVLAVGVCALDHARGTALHDEVRAAVHAGRERR